MQKGPENQVIVLNPSPTMRIRLSKSAHVRAEMARVYVECRAGMMDPADGTKYIFMLQNIGKQITDTILEQRIEQLESGKGGPLPSISMDQFADESV